MVGPVVGGLTLVLIFPPARLAPSLSWARVRPLLGFGFQFQAVAVVNLLRDQATNAAVALFAGVSALGVWAVAYRILQIPLLFLGSLWRVSFPGMSRLVAAGGDAGKTVERIIGVVAVASGLLLAPLVAATPAWVPPSSVRNGTVWFRYIPSRQPPSHAHRATVGRLAGLSLGGRGGFGGSESKPGGAATDGSGHAPTPPRSSGPRRWIRMACVGCRGGDGIDPEREKALRLQGRAWTCPANRMCTVGPPLAGSLRSVVTRRRVLGSSVVSSRSASTCSCSLTFHRKQLLDTAHLAARGVHGIARGPATSKV